jgi:hypothetical protein
MGQAFEEQISDIFAEFVNGSQTDDTIKQLYEVLPYCSHEQQRIIILYRTLAVKYQSPALQEMADSLERLAKHNRKLGFSFTRLLEAYSLHKHFKGYKASSNVTENKE